MTAQELFNAGELSKSLEALSAQVRAQPADYTLRTFLFELLCFSGDWERAAKHLDVIAQQGPDSELAVQTYRNALAAEEARRHVFSANGIPGLPKQIPSYTGSHLEAIHCLRDGHSDKALQLLEQAAESYIARPGQLNGRPFSTLCDCDDVLGPFLEVLVGSSYSWVPWECIQSISISPPKYLRDLLWLPADIELTFGPLRQVLLPCLYPGSDQNPNELIKLGRMTDWRTGVDGLAIGMGQKLLDVDGEEMPIASVREIEFEAPVEQEVAGADA